MPPDSQDCAGCKPWRVEYKEKDATTGKLVEKSVSIKGYAKAVRWARNNVASGEYDIVPDDRQKSCC